MRKELNKKKKKKFNMIFDKEGNKQPEIETYNDADEEIDTKNTQNHCQRITKNSINNDTVDNQDDMNNSEMTEIGEIKQSE